MGHLGRAGTIVLALTLAVGVAACGDDDDDDGAASSTTEAAEPATVEVTAIDYGYEGLPEDPIAAGTQLTFTNSSAKELHELVAFLLSEDEERSAEEISKLPEAELGQLFAGEPATVLLALPDGGDMIPAVGDGTIDDAGRYVIFCAIPLGADPQAYLDAAEASQGGPPEVEGGPPHFTQGMYGELTVE